MPVGTLEAVFLDLGNTLIRERSSRAAIYAEEARLAGLEVSAERVGACMTRANAVLPRELDGAFRYSDAWFRAFQRRIFVDELGLEPARFAELSERLFARFESGTTFELYPGARELLDGLRAGGLVLGLISNWSERLPRLLDALGLAPAFDLVLGSAALRLEKPEPALFAEALRRAGTRPERSLHAGDQLEKDVLGALRAGLRAVLVDHEGRADPGARSLCPVVESLRELQDLILDRAA